MGLFRVTFLGIFSTRGEKYYFTRGEIYARWDWNEHRKTRNSEKLKFLFWVEGSIGGCGRVWGSRKVGYVRWISCEVGYARWVSCEVVSRKVLTRGGSHTRWVSHKVGLMRGGSHVRWVTRGGSHEVGVRWVSCEVGWSHVRWVTRGELHEVGLKVGYMRRLHELHVRWVTRN